jgi:hypothetical protein
MIERGLEWIGHGFFPIYKIKKADAVGHRLGESGSGTMKGSVYPTTKKIIFQFQEGAIREDNRLLFDGSK